MTTILGARQAHHLLEEVVDEFGRRYVDPASQSEYGGCDYTATDSENNLICGCIVGQVLVKAGAELEALDCLYGTIGFLKEEVKGLMDIELTLGARLVLRAAQRVQDKGGEWGDAFLAADDTFRILALDGMD